jgi:uncharacterized protein YpbB
VNFEEAIILFGIRQMNGERTTSGLFHILTGKKSSQVIQDGKLFTLSNLFGTMSNITYAAFTSIVHSLSKEGLIIWNSDNHPLITDYGVDCLTEYLKEHAIPNHLNGWRYRDMSIVFWRRITLFVQTLSHLRIDDRHFYPIQNDPDILMWVKNHFPFEEKAQVHAAEMLYGEFYHFLQTIDPKDAENIVYRLTRSGRVGKTTTQIASLLSMDPVECSYRFQGAIHQLIRQLLEDPGRAPGLYTFVKDLDRPYTLTESTLKTYKLLQKNFPLEEVATFRRLKMNTIEDHIVEIAIHVLDFPIEHYITADAQEEIHRESIRLDTRKLKTIKESLGDRFSYFQIRLALARLDVRNDRRLKGEANAVT